MFREAQVGDSGTAAEEHVEGHSDENERQQREKGRALLFECGNVFAYFYYEMARLFSQFALFGRHGVSGFLGVRGVNYLGYIFNGVVYLCNCICSILNRCGGV